MIQRKQSLYLFVSLILSLILLYISLGSKTDSLIFCYKLFFLSPLLSMLTFLLFKKRTIQIKLCNILIFFQFSFLAYYGYNIVIGVIFEETYYTIIFSSLNTILLFLARTGILKDEALIRSVDRIR